MFLEDKRSEFQVLASDCQSTPIYKNESYLELVYGTTKKRKIKLWLIDRWEEKKKISALDTFLAFSFIETSNWKQKITPCKIQHFKMAYVHKDF